MKKYLYVLLICLFCFTSISFATGPKINLDYKIGAICDLEESERVGKFAILMENETKKTITVEYFATKDKSIRGTIEVPPNTDFADKFYLYIDVKPLQDFKELTMKYYDSSLSRTLILNVNQCYVKPETSELG